MSADAGEARERAYDVFGFDAYTRIAVENISGDLKDFRGMPAPGSPEEAKLIELGAVVSQFFGFEPTP
jgi:hypothetical protein